MRVWYFDAFVRSSDERDISGIFLTHSNCSLQVYLIASRPACRAVSCRIALVSYPVYLLGFMSSTVFFYLFLSHCVLFCLK